VQNIVTGKLEDFPSKWMKPYIYDKNIDKNITVPEEVAMTDEQYFIVEKIIDHKPPGKILKLSAPKRNIKFKTYYIGDKNPTWVSYSILRDNEILHEYLTSLT
jgi:hypothetical protein